MRQSSMEQYFTSISSFHEIWFCLATKRPLIHQKTSDYLVESYQIFTDGLLDLQALNKIKFYVVICKTFIAATRLVKGSDCPFFDVAVFDVVSFLIS